MEKILIVEDDTAISDLIKMNLNMVGYETEQVYDGQAALEALNRSDFDLALLDVMLPKLDGFSILEQKKDSGVPIIFLTAKGAVTDRVRGLKMGAEDYIVKPFDAIELLARIEVVLRRSGKKSSVLHYRDLEIHLDQMLVKKSGLPVELTFKEFELLRILVQNKGMALSRDVILEKVWGYDYFGETRTVDMHIQKLRKKLDLESEISTIYKFGYRLEA